MIGWVVECENEIYEVDKQKWQVDKRWQVKWQVDKRWQVKWQVTQSKSWGESHQPIHLTNNIHQLWMTKDNSDHGRWKEMWLETLFMKGMRSWIHHKISHFYHSFDSTSPLFLYHTLSNDYFHHTSKSISLLKVIYPSKEVVRIV